MRCRKRGRQWGIESETKENAGKQKEGAQKKNISMDQSGLGLVWHVNWSLVVTGEE